ncbi:uncharacterized protein MONOS_8110 [Monocercomonoides exilis]|uniref:uncharacterized protein n=1 Tax=Monocercomonoides exilis TaxID=2049356 RepID=UPI00355A1AFF|nr:hypothetical protein MONOS_8110 [Monocercomonoides exilis]|eukprot:MONOS_8110.1-p1 / transcript=MONOS_8110.1 / gene=MONOS_8110 / organism=Monocercomonoides_exilis_PA203 / gene_product=unspecified product / transcript_product=unspecified product / location=Mono_scaffold00296:48046-48366(-) / protein_length=107 / sequence_SO=supercontig / SO=protein_coding / is_pseudo=false
MACSATLQNRIVREKKGSEVMKEKEQLASADEEEISCHSKEYEVRLGSKVAKSERVILAHEDQKPGPGSQLLWSNDGTGKACLQMHPSAITKDNSTQTSSSASSSS